MGEQTIREHVLTGFVGSNFVAFLGSIGALRLLRELSNPPINDVRLFWGSVHPYHPILRLDVALTKTQLIERLHAAIERFHATAFLVDTYRVVPEIPVRNFAEEIERACVGSGYGDRIGVDWLSSLAFEGGRRAAEGENKERETLLPPRIVVFNNAKDGTAFVQNARGLLQETSVDHLRASIFEVWDYDDYVDGRPSLRLGWDPREVLSSIALGDVAKKIRWKPFEQGANALAVVGFTLMTAVPLVGIPGGNPGNVLVTREGREERLSWPLWGTPLGLDEVRSVITRRDVHRDPPPAWLNKVGIAQVVSATIEGGKSRRVGPSRYAF